MAEKITDTPLKSPQLLWDLYQNIVFRWQNTPLVGKNFIIITAFNPRSVCPGEQINLHRQRSLYAQLKSMTELVAELEVGDPELSYSEPSLAADIAVKDAMSLAEQYEQNAIYVVKDGQLSLAPVLMSDRQTAALGQFSDFVITDG